MGLHPTAGAAVRSTDADAVSRSSPSRRPAVAVPTRGCRGSVSRRVPARGLGAADVSERDAPGVAAKVGGAILEVVSRVPMTRETPLADPDAQVRRLARQAARRAAVVSGGLALPPGPLGVLTLIPDLMAIWKIQAQLVADIAGARGRSGSLTREQLLYCLFRHAASQVLRDVVVRAGERAVVHRLTVSAIQAIASRLGIHLSQQLIAKSAGRFVPGLGAAAVAAYAWWDTERVARIADELFSREIVVAPERTGATVETPVRGRRLHDPVSR
jgi:hypothetical protein